MLCLVHTYCDEIDDEVYCSLEQDHKSLEHMAFPAHDKTSVPLKTWPIEQKQEEKVFHGVKSTKIPRYELIPMSLLDCAALIFEKGIVKKGDGAWNALTLNKEEALKDKDFVIERLSHVIKHAYSAIRKVQDGNEWEGEEDAGAIAFGAAVLAEYKRMRREDADRGT